MKATHIASNTLSIEFPKNLQLNLLSKPSLGSLIAAVNSDISSEN